MVRDSNRLTPTGSAVCARIAFPADRVRAGMGLRGRRGIAAATGAVAAGHTAR